MLAEVKPACFASDENINTDTMAVRLISTTLVMKDIEH